MDLSLTLCLIENLIEKGDWAELMQKFVQYMESGYWTPHHEIFQYGRTTSEP